MSNNGCEKIVEIAHLYRIWCGGANEEETVELAENIRSLAHEIFDEMMREIKR